MNRKISIVLLILIFVIPGCIAYATNIANSYIRDSVIYSDFANSEVPNLNLYSDAAILIDSKTDSVLY